jgi:hypothetical protein
MDSPGWRQKRGSSPEARRGARQRPGLTAVAASNTFSCQRKALRQKHPRPPKITLTTITVSTTTLDQERKSRLRSPNGTLARQNDRVFADSGGPESGVREGMKLAAIEKARFSNYGE